MSELVEVKQTEVKSNNSEKMHPLVSAAMAAGTELTPDNLSKLLDVQKDWEANEARKAYSAAMVQFRSECPNIIKDAVVDYQGSKGRTYYEHETLDGILKTISPALSQCGINPTFRTSTDNGVIIVTCRVTHSQGHYEETSLPAVADTSGGKNAIQGIGSTVTYLQRYTLKAMLGLSAGYDDDAIEDNSKEAYTEKKFDENFPKWLDAVESGKKSAMAIITHLSNGWSLTEDQLSKVYKLKDIKEVKSNA